MDVGNLAYLSLTAIVGLSYFVGRLSMRVDVLDRTQEQARQTAEKIFNKLDELTALAAANSAYHLAADTRRTSDHEQ